MAKANINVSTSTNTGVSSFMTDVLERTAAKLASAGNSGVESAMQGQADYFNANQQTNNPVEQTAPTSEVSSGFTQSQGFSGAGELSSLTDRVDQVRSDEGLSNKVPLNYNSGNRAPQVDFGLDTPIFRPIDSHGVSDDISGMLNRADNLGKAMAANNFTINYHPNENVLDYTLEAYAAQAKSARDLQENATTQEEFDAARLKTFEILDNQYDRDTKSRNVLPSVLHNLDGFVLTENGRYSFDPEFAKLISMVTENHLADTYLGTEDTTETVEGLPESKEDTGPLSVINPMDAANRLGGEIEKWQTIQKRSDGGPAPIRPLSEDEKKALGAMALQTFQLSNPEIVEARRLSTEEAIKFKDDGNGIRYVLSENVGVPEFENSRATRSKLFGVNVPPSHVEPQQVEQYGDLEKIKPAFRGEKKLGFLGNIYEAMFNQSKVGHVVDDKRAKLLMLVAAPAILSKPIDNHPFAEVFGVGKLSYDKVVVRENKGNGTPIKEAEQMASQIMVNKKRKLLDEISSIFKNRNVINYLSFYAQPLTARTGSNQTLFNPTVSKVVRFVTRSAAPIVVAKGTQLETNLLQMYASTLLSGKIKNKEGNVTSNLSARGLSTPSERVKNLGRHIAGRDQQKLADFEKWGKSLNDAVGSFDNKNMNRVSEAIASGIPLNDPRFPKIDYDKFQKKFLEDKAMRNYLNDFGEDVLLAMDTLMDFANFMDARRSGKDHITTLNSYFDGKTNGIASQALQIGNAMISGLTGVLRPVNAKYVLHEENGAPMDVRDYMSTFINKRIDEGRSQLPIGHSHDVKVVYNAVLKDMGSYRQLNKIISMVFPYGKETSAMGSEVEENFFNKVAEDSTFKDSIEWLNGMGVDSKNIMNAVHENVVSSLMELFGDNTFKARALMRNSALLFAAMDKVFTIRGPVGHDINLGGDKKDVSQAQLSTIKVKDDTTGKSSSLISQTSPRYSSAASADNDGSIARDAFGQSPVIPTQAIDAATVIKTFAGKSWDRIKGRVKGEKPYVYQIYDAFKVDVASYDSVLKEVNENWLETSINDWNFFQESYDSVRVGMDEFMKDMKSKDQNSMNELSIGNKFDFIGVLMNGKSVESTTGNRRSFRALLAMSKSINPLDAKSGESSLQYDLRVHEQAAQIFNSINSGFNSGNRISAGIYQDSENNDRVGFTENKDFKEIESLSNRDIIRVVDYLYRKSDYVPRMRSFLQVIDRDKRALRGKINRLKRRSGEDLSVFQYYAK